MSDAGKILEDAAGLVDRGWCQGRMFLGTPEGMKCCIIGAIQVAAADILLGEERVRFYRKADILLSAIAHKAGFDVIADWNDAPGRTAEEVASALRELAREEGE